MDQNALDLISRNDKLSSQVKLEKLLLLYMESVNKFLVKFFKFQLSPTLFSSDAVDITGYIQTESDRLQGIKTNAALDFSPVSISGNQFHSV